MDWSSLAGLALALGGIVFAQHLEGGSMVSLLQPAAFVVVCFGTVGAVMLQTQFATLVHGIRLLKTIAVLPLDQRSSLARKIKFWGAIVRNDGLLALELYANQETDPNLKKGLRMIIDGNTAAKIREVLAIDIELYEAKQRNAIKVWDSAGGYAPTVGILGAVLGLIHVMENLSDPTLLGSGIAIAFVATIYGVGLANLVFLPIANKLRAGLSQETITREMMLAGMVAIANQEHPQVIEERMQSYLRSG